MTGKDIKELDQLMPIIIEIAKLSKQQHDLKTQSKVP